MITYYAGIAGTLAANIENYIYNCKRNRNCTRTYFVPLPSLLDLLLYFDLSQVGKPVSYEVHLFKCTNNYSYGVTFDNYIVAQNTNNEWYAVFTGLNEFYSSLPLSTFYIRASFYDINNNEHLFYSQHIELAGVNCSPFTRIDACYNDSETGSKMYDVNGTYYGYHAGTGSLLGNPLLRYYHYAFVRDANIIPTETKFSLTLFNSRNAYKNIISDLSVFSFELVPDFYKAELLAILARGVIAVDGKEYKLDASQTYKVNNTDYGFWSLDTNLNKYTELNFSCKKTICIPKPMPCFNSFTSAVVSLPDTIIVTHVWTIETTLQGNGVLVKLYDNGVLTNAPQQITVVVSITYNTSSETGLGNNFTGIIPTGGNTVFVQPTDSILSTGSSVVSITPDLADLETTTQTTDGTDMSVTLSGGTFDESVTASYVLYEESIIKETGTIDTSTLPVTINFTTPYDLTKCYRFVYSKTCVNGSINTQETKFGNCCKLTLTPALFDVSAAYCNKPFLSNIVLSGADTYTVSDIVSDLQGIHVLVIGNTLQLKGTYIGTCNIPHNLSFLINGCYVYQQTLSFITAPVVIPPEAPTLIFFGAYPWIGSAAPYVKLTIDNPVNYLIVFHITVISTSPGSDFQFIHNFDVAMNANQTDAEVPFEMQLDNLISRRCVRSVTGGAVDYSEFAC